MEASSRPMASLRRLYAGANALGDVGAIVEMDAEAFRVRGERSGEVCAAFDREAAVADRGVAGQSAECGT